MNDEKMCISVNEAVVGAYNKILELIRKRNIIANSAKLRTLYAKKIAEWTDEEVAWEAAFDYKVITIAIYGHYDAGKTYLAELIKSKLEQDGVNVMSSSMTPERTSYDFLSFKWKYYYYHVLIWQVPWYRDTNDRRHLEKDPNLQLARVIGKGCDLNIAVYHPELIAPAGSVPQGSYDIIVKNTDSESKRG